MIYTAHTTPAADLMDAGVAPADAIAVGALAQIGLSAVAATCNALVDKGATPEEVDAYRRGATADLAEWMNRHQPEARAFFSEVIAARRERA
ncbi:MAG: hypothetical protein WBA44_09585 [Mesorhizobium sp.]